MVVEKKEFQLNIQIPLWLNVVDPIIIATDDFFSLSTKKNLSRLIELRNKVWYSRGRSLITVIVSSVQLLLLLSDMPLDGLFDVRKYHHIIFDLLCELKIEKYKWKLKALQQQNNGRIDGSWLTDWLRMWPMKGECISWKIILVVYSKEKKKQQQQQHTRNG